MANKKNNKGGRPLTEFSQKQFEDLCAMQCTKVEICSWFNTTDKTLERWCKRVYGAGFSEVFNEKRCKGFISLRRSQFRLAEHNATMAIWLGKQYLGQKDEKSLEVATETLPTVITGSDELE